MAPDPHPMTLYFSYQDAVQVCTLFIGYMQEAEISCKQEQVADTVLPMILAKKELFELDER